MKKAILIIVAILLCMSAFGCVESQRVHKIYLNKALLHLCIAERSCGCRSGLPRAR